MKGTSKGRWTSPNEGCVKFEDNCGWIASHVVILQGRKKWDLFNDFEGAIHADSHSI